MFYKLCENENGRYVNQYGERCDLLICNEVIFPEDITDPSSKGFYEFEDDSKAIKFFDLEHIDNL